MYERLFQEIKKSELIQLTQNLIRIPSVRRQEAIGGEKEIAAYVASYLEEVGLDIVVEEVEPRSPNVIAVFQGREEGPCLMFECHTDVVTEGDPSEWTYGPFEGERRGNRIYGRGACDTKGNLAAAILAVKAIVRSDLPFRGKILLGILADEEGMMRGVKHFIHQGWTNGVHAAIVCEPVDNRVCITQKGAIRAEVITSGKMSHGAMPLAGLNPIPPMMAILEKMSQLEADEIQRLGKDAFLGYPSITPTVVQAPAKGEPQLNVVPSQCRALLDIRTIPGQSHETLKSRLESTVEEVEKSVCVELKSGRLREVREKLHRGLSKGIAFEAKIDFFEDRPWTKTSPDEPIVRAVSQAYRAITGKGPVYGGVPGATDGTFLSAWAGIPIVTTGAGKWMIPHQKDEWVSLSSLFLTARLYAASAMEFLKT